MDGSSMRLVIVINLDEASLCFEEEDEGSVV
jgi:hypothetical protein